MLWKRKHWLHAYGGQHFVATTQVVVHIDVAVGGWHAL
jgi:hypothetical protein